MWGVIYRFLSTHLFLVAVAMFVGIAVRSIRRRRALQKKAAKKYREIIANEMHEPNSMYPKIDQALCGGCGTCVAACPEGKIIGLINHKATLIEPGKCVGHGLCATSCPFGAITLVFGSTTKGMPMPRLDCNFETNVPGLYVAGELGGMGLIRNAVKQGRLAAIHAGLQTHASPKAMYEVVVIGAGPAGLSAALALKEQGKKYICLEQNRFGGSICNYPRQKIVMSQPLDFALAGAIQFERHKISKEELLELWHTMWKKYHLNIREGVNFNNLEKKGPLFTIATARGPITTQKVILAMGVRGTPRKLGIPGEDGVQVTYNLEEPEQYQHNWVAVVGAGNAAVEVAVALCSREYHNRVYLLVRGKGFSRCNEENQDKIMHYSRKGRVKILFETVVKSVSQGAIEVDQGGHRFRLQNDYLFIMAGALLPYDFLQGMGIEIVVKYGEPVYPLQQISS